MTLNVLQYFNKQVLYTLFPASTPVTLELPFMAPLIDLLSDRMDAPLTCSCCKWKGSELKARKHYLIVEAIAEIELFCPTCNHYLGFIAEPAS